MNLTQIENLSETETYKQRVAQIVTREKKEREQKSVASLFSIRCLLSVWAVVDVSTSSQIDGNNISFTVKHKNK